jgi:hypothetical protein
MEKIIGKKFNKLTVLKFHSYKKSRPYFVFRCDCGNEKVLRLSHVTSGDIKACGCLQGKQSVTHGMKKTRFYKIWQAIKTRCENPSWPGYSDYGGRGIKVCDRWHKFENFRDDMHKSYKQNLTIERIDNNKGYSKENCRWASRKEQARNRRSNRIVSYQGRKMIFIELAELLGINYQSLYSKLITHNK